MKKVLIFGINGFVGQYLAKEFLAHEYQVVGSDIQEPEAEKNLFRKIDFFQSDLLNAQEVRHVVEQIQPDMVINLAAISSVGLSWKLPQKTMEVNVIGALNLLEAVRTCVPGAKVMFIGSSEEYESSDQPMNEETALNANNPYGISKMTQELFATLYREKYGMKVYYVRPFNHTGIGQKESFVLPSFCKQVAEIEKSGQSGVIYTGNLEIYRDFSDVRDVVRAYRMILESEECSKVYNVGSGEAHGLKDLLEYLISLSSQKIEIQVSKELFRPADTPRICCDRRYIENELGWKPQYSIFDTLRDMYEHFLLVE